MIQVCRFKVRSLDVRFFELSWQIADTTEQVLDYTFAVERSESDMGPWDAISPAFTDRYVFYDRTADVMNQQRVWSYRLRITNKLTDETTFSEVADHQPEADLITQEVRRHMMILLHEFAGRRCWFFPRRSFGQRCASCFNVRLGATTKSGCRDCFDTGFARGYMAPIEVWAQIDPGGNQVIQRTNVGALQPMNTTARFVGPSNVKPLDLLIEAENRRWRVVQNNQTEHGRSTIHHELQLHEIPKSDIEYLIPIPLETELRDIMFSPSRNFTNPHNLEGARNEDFAEIMSLYGGSIYDSNE